MVSHDLKRAPEALEAVACQLEDWFMSLGSDYMEKRWYIGRHQLETYDYTRAAEKIKEIAEGVQPERQVRLKVGRMAVESVRFHRSAYDVSQMSFNNLDPGVELELCKADFVQYRMLDETREELFVGWVDRLPLSEIARTLHDGGELSIVEVSAAAAPAQT